MDRLSGQVYYGQSSKGYLSFFWRILGTFLERVTQIVFNNHIVENTFLNLVCLLSETLFFVSKTHFISKMPSTEIFFDVWKQISHTDTDYGCIVDCLICSCNGFHFCFVIYKHNLWVSKNCLHQFFSWVLDF